MTQPGLSWSFASHIAAIGQCPTNLATQRAQRTPGVCDLTIGDVKFDTPEHIKQAAIRSIQANDTHYSHVQGTPQLRQAIAAKFRRDNGLDYAEEDIVVGNGAGQLMFAALFATLSPGDEVIIPTPCWDNYADMVLLNRGVPRFVGGAGGCRVGVADVLAAITPRSRWIILNNPNNPGGFVWTEDELRAVAAGIVQSGASLGVIADETFEALCFGKLEPVSFAALPGMRARTLTVNGLSKSHAMSGWRIGYAAGPRELIGKITVFNANTTYSLCNAAQAAAVAALADSAETRAALQQLKASIAASRFAALSRLSLLSEVSFTWPEAGYFVLLDVRALLAAAGATPQQLCDHLLDQAHVAATDAAGFRAPGFIRLSFAGPEELIAEAYDRVVRSLMSFPLPRLALPATAPRDDALAAAG